MKPAGFLSSLPILTGIVLLVLVVFLWPERSSGGNGLLAWLNIALLILLAFMLFRYGWHVWRDRRGERPGSHIRAKLVTALVGMLLIPSLILQVTASQMVERGLNVWFDVRVDTLLDRALDLARSFYARVEGDLKQGLLAYVHDPELLTLLAEQGDYTQLNARLERIRRQEGWQRLQLFDINHRLIAGVQSQGLGALEPQPLGEQATLALVLGRVATELQSVDGKEVVVGYAPLSSSQGIVALLRAEIKLPEGVVENARAVESDYRTYRELERHRQAIKETFANAMLLTTLLVVLIAGWVALLFARRLTAPIAGLAGALKRVTEGDLNVSIREAPDDELGFLVQAFNKMAKRLRENMEALEQAKAELTQALANSRQRQHILETLLANLQSGVLLLDGKGRVQLYNEALKNLLLLPSAWTPGRDVARLTNGRLQGIGIFIEELRKSEQGFMQQEIDLHAGRKTLHLLARGARLRMGGGRHPVGYLVVLDDISWLAEAQRNRAWSEVARRLAHEIKNPLTPIKLAAERLHRRFRNQVDDADVFDACTNAIITQVERLQRLISDFSTLARLPRPQLRNVEVGQLLREMQDLYSSYHRVEVELQRGEGIICPCDPDQVRQVLINLLDNALAATAVGHEKVRLWAEAEDGSVVFHVEDWGEGVSEEGEERLFEPYFSTKEDGSGLGLAIAKRIAEEHGGDIALVSRAKPTHFVLRLPMNAASVEAA